MTTQHEAWNHTILRPLQQWLKLEKLPKDRQYVTLGGTAELNHMLEAGIIEPEQFHGVEMNATTHATQRKHLTKNFPDRTKRPALHKGEFQRVYRQLVAEDDFRPAIVNIDTDLGPRKGVEALSTVLRHFGNKEDGLENVVVVVTVRSKLTRRGDELSTLLKEHYSASRWIDLGGWFVTVPYPHQRNSASMETVVLFRGPRDIYFKYAN